VAAGLEPVHPIACDATAGTALDAPGGTGPDFRRIDLTGTVTAASGQQQSASASSGTCGAGGTHHAAAIFQFFTPGVISAQSASFTCK
jgi:hypothetical protein